MPPFTTIPTEPDEPGSTAAPILAMPLPFKVGDVWVTQTGVKHKIIHLNPLVTLAGNCATQWNDRGEHYSSEHGRIDRLAMREPKTAELLIVISRASPSVPVQLTLHSSKALCNKRAVNLAELEASYKTPANRSRIIAMHRTPPLAIE